MSEETDDTALAKNYESLAFVDGAIKMDKDKFLALTKLVNELIDSLQTSKANPVTIYYITRALDSYAGDRLRSFGKGVEEKKPDESNITADSLANACDQLFAQALEEAQNMNENDRQKLIEERLDPKKNDKEVPKGYA